jgi:azurin
MAAVGLVMAAKVATLAAAPAPRVVALTADDTMKFSVPVIQAKKGEELTIKLTSKGTLPKEAMAHNFILLAKGTNADDFAMQAAMARATDYIPEKLKDKIIAHTKLAGPGETVEITFKVPAVVGSYTFICSFAGHYAAGMKGTLVVQ